MRRWGDAADDLNTWNPKTPHHVGWRSWRVNEHNAWSRDIMWKNTPFWSLNPCTFIRINARAFPSHSFGSCATLCQDRPLACMFFPLCWDDKLHSIIHLSSWPTQLTLGSTFFQRHEGDQQIGSSLNNKGSVPQHVWATHQSAEQLEKQALVFR